MNYPANLPHVVEGLLDMMSCADKAHMHATDGDWVYSIQADGPHLRISLDHKDTRLGQAIISTYLSGWDVTGQIVIKKDEVERDIDSVRSLSGFGAGLSGLNHNRLTEGQD